MGFDHFRAGLIRVSRNISQLANEADWGRPEPGAAADDDDSSDLIDIMEGILVGLTALLVEGRVPAIPQHTGRRAARPGPGGATGPGPGPYPEGLDSDCTSNDGDFSSDCSDWDSAGLATACGYN